MKLSDYVFQFLVKHDITHVFGIVGGANSHLADSLARNPNIRMICTQHEQAAAMAAEGYARASGKIGAVLVTSGPGGTNAITGTCGAWTDSIPCVFISGQLPTNLTTDGKTIRQLGVQQLNIIEIVKSFTKYAVMIINPNSIKYHLQKAFHLAISGRPGPVWLDIPTEIQRANIDPEILSNFSDKAESYVIDIKQQLEISELIGQAKRPILIAGNGIRLAGAEKEFLDLVGCLGFPVITTWSGIDLISHNHPLYIGCAGVMGQRGANYAVANADLILSIGSRLDTRQVGNSPELYARSAKKIVVDIDPHELAKKLIQIDVPVICNARYFINWLLYSIKSQRRIQDISSWVSRCGWWREKYPVVPDSYSLKHNMINSYVFIEKLCRQLAEDETVVTDMGASLTCTMQTFRKREQGQRLFTNIGFAAMGFGLPSAIGAWFGSQNRRIIGIFGDGGFQMNIQELQTVIHYQIPIIIFILNNKSYLTIKHTQETFFEGYYAGSELGSGYSAPNFVEIGRAYGLTTFRLDSAANLNEKIKLVLDNHGPTLCEIMMDENQALVPVAMLDKSKGYAGSPLERMYPFLPEEEHRANMIIDPV